ncbi:MAG: FGGY-family carbohydrate kinase [Anaerolineae bacterium]
MAEKYLLGIDIGTYESKGVITTLDGRVVSAQVSPHKMDIPRQGWAEHDPEGVWWGDFVSITRRLIAESGVDPRDILGVGLSTIAPDVLPVDKDCKPLRKGGILYGVDTRAAVEIEELNAAIGAETIFKKTGNMLSSQATGPKILWLKKNEPEVYKKAYKFVTASTFLVARLTGNYVIDHLTGSFCLPLYDFEKRQWDDSLTKEIVELDRLPELRWANEVAGYVTAEAAGITGLLEGTPVIVGTADAASEAVSVGVTDPGQMMLMYGSTIFMIEVLDKPVMDTRLWANPYLFEGTSALLAGMATSGSLTRWFRDHITTDLVKAEEEGGPNAYGAITQEALAIPPGSEGLLVLPYFSGERTPINDPRARGVYFGLTLAHTRAHMFRAAIEGISYGVRHHLDIMREIGAEPHEIIAVGGGTKSPLWLQTVSDVCQVPQKVPAVTLGASYGDAFLAGMGAGVFQSPAEINKWLTDIRVVEPNPAVAPIYDRYMKLYLELYNSTKDLMHEVYTLA